MSGFSAEWLALREPADWRSRSARVTEAVRCALPPERATRALDLAAGTGSNMRFLAPALTTAQEWLLVDRDPDLLQRARQLAGPDVHTHIADLTQTKALERLVAAHDLVTASALLDLVSEEWLKAVCESCGTHRVVELFALSYDGRLTCAPEEPEDALVRDLVNRHQHTNKGFGRALGPDAARCAIGHLEKLGYQVVHDRSDWVLDRESTALQVQLIEGWAAAATEIAPGEAALIARWRERRIGHAVGERSRVIVGHEDLGAFIA